MRLIVLIGFVFLLLIGVAQAGDWPMFGHDAAHTGATDEVVEPPLEVLWKYRTGSFSILGSSYSGSVSSPAVYKGVVYVSSLDGHVYALDASTGSLKWKYQTGAGVSSTPAVSEGLVFTVSHDDNIYALDAETGALKWKYQTDGCWLYSPAVCEGVVYVGNTNGYLYALYANTGNLKWKYQTGAEVSSTPAISEGVVYVGSGYYVYALDATTGILKWKYQIGNTSSPADSVSTPAVLGGVVYIGGASFDPENWMYYGHVYALDATTGTLKWKYPTTAIGNSPAVSGGVVYFSPIDNDVYALDASTGNLKWIYHTTYSVSSSPAVSGGVVYVTSSNDGNLYALDASTGRLKWNYEIGVSSNSQKFTVVSNGVVYVSSDSTVYAFTPATSNQTNWMLVSVILVILLIGAVALLWFMQGRKEKKQTPTIKPTVKSASLTSASKIELTSESQGKSAGVNIPFGYKRATILIILLIVIGSMGYTVYQKYSPLSELADCGNNCIDYKKVKVVQYETSVPDIKITETDVEKLIMDVPIIIRNPSAKDTKTVKIDFDVSMEGKHLTKGTIPAYELPAKQNTTILIKDVVIKYEELGDVIKTVTEKHGAEMVIEGKANISMTTDLLIYFPIEIFSINIYTFTIPIQIETEVPVDMLKQNEDAKKQIEEKVKIAIKEVQDKTNGGLPDIPTEIPTPTMVPTSTPTQPLPTSSLLI